MYKNNLSQFENLPTDMQLIIDELINRGVKCEQLNNTDVIIAEVNSREYFFVKPYTPLVPYIHGLHFSDEEYSKKIIENGGLSVNVEKAKFASNQFRVFITENGFYNILERNNPNINNDGYFSIESLIDRESELPYKDVTSTSNTNLYVLAKKLLLLFPHLGYVCFETNNSVITRVDLSLNPNIFYEVTNGKEIKKAVEVIADLIIKRKDTV
jgi:hypothetical protein